MDGVLDFERRQRLLPRASRLQLIVTFEYSLCVLLAGPIVREAAISVDICDLTRDKAIAFLHRVSEYSGRAYKYRFSSEAADEIYSYTSGDLYFTQWLAALSISTAFKGTRSTKQRQRPRIISKHDVGAAAQDVIQLRSDDPYIIPALRNEVRNNPRFADGLKCLYVEGAECWFDIPRDIRELLFTIGVVSHKVLASQLDLPEYYEEHAVAYQLRNRLIKQLVRGLTMSPQDGTATTSDKRGSDDASTLFHFGEIVSFNEESAACWIEAKPGVEIMVDVPLSVLTRIRQKPGAEFVLTADKSGTLAQDLASFFASRANLQEDLEFERLKDELLARATRLHSQRHQDE